MATGLALSGGGFRATLFHLGVIRRLCAERLLDQLSCVASVSGGSVTAAHVLRNWEAYKSNPDDFDKFAKKLISITQIDVRGRIQRRLLLLWLLALIPFLPKRWRLSPTGLLARYYDKYLFHKASTKSVKNAISFAILSTNLSRAELACFGRSSVAHIPLNIQMPSAPIEANLISFAKVVAASSAYPGFFPPISIDDQELGAIEGSIQNQYFTDAGVYDNLGLCGLKGVSDASKASLDHILLSDAGRSFVPSKYYEFGIMRTALRAVDIFMFRVRQSDLNLAKDEPTTTLISISSRALIAGASPEEIQVQLQNIRTDLDKFSDLEVSELIRHGYYVTAQALAEHRGEKTPRAIPEWDIPEAPWVKSPATVSANARSLQQSARRRWRLVSVRDGMSLLHLALLACVVGGFIVLSPLLVETSKSFSAFIRAQHLVKLDPQWSDIPQTPIEVVDTFDRTINDGFEVLADDRVWDLRRLRREAFDGSQVTGESLLLRVSSLIRRSEDARLYKYRYQTAGTKFVAWSLDKDVGVRLLRSRKTTRSGFNELNTYELQFDVSRFDLGEKFELRAQAKILNAPWDRNNSWVGMRITDNTLEATMRVIFPKDLPYQRPIFQKYPNDSVSQAQTFDGIAFNLAQEKELLWSLDRPQKGWTYRAQWDWQ